MAFRAQRRSRGLARALAALVALSFLSSLLAAYAHLARDHGNLDLHHHPSPATALDPDQTGCAPSQGQGAPEEPGHEAPSGEEDCPWAAFLAKALALSDGTPNLVAEGLPSPPARRPQRHWFPTDGERYRDAPKTSPPPPRAGLKRA